MVVCQLVMKRLLLVLLLIGPPMARAADSPPITFYIQLVCGSDSTTPPSPQAKLVGQKLDQRLRDVFRWKNYWEVRRESVSLKTGGSVRRRITPERDVEIDLPTDHNMTISMYLDGKLTRKRQQSVDAAFYIAGGDTSASDSWFIIVRRDNPDVSPAFQKAGGDAELIPIKP
jgi:hypothetical protein